MAVASAAPSPAAAPPRSFSYAAYAALLTRYVDPAGHVDYASLRRDPGPMQKVLAQFAVASPQNRPERFATRNDQLAYWINAYNLFVIAGVTRHWPAATVRGDGNAFFTTERFRAGGRAYTLDGIESDIIRKGFGEPRIHFTINCGALSCPALAPRPFTGADLESRLDAAARSFVNDPEVGVRIDTTSATVTLSEIFRWYEGDFLAALTRAGAAHPTILDYVAQYLDPPARTALAARRYAIRYRPYDWTVNATTLPVR